MAESSPPLNPTTGWIERIFGAFSHSKEWIARELWLDDPKESILRRGLRSLAQLVALTIRGFQTDHLLLRASALTYVTAISLIPVLGVLFAIIGLVGGDETLVDFVIDQLTTVAPEARENIRGYVDNLNFARFGTIGGALVFGTAIFALRHLERTLNDIWGVSSSRGWARRFSDYLAVLVVAPISTGVAVSLATTLQAAPLVTRVLDVPFLSELYGLGLSQVPLAFLFVGFTFLYWFFPNTHVHVRAAALGGLVAAVLFAAARTVYVDFQVGAANYQAVFGALSAVPLILVWLYACWAVLLLGAEVAFAFQNLKSARREMRVGAISPTDREAVALELAVAIGRSFSAGEEPPTAMQLADALDEPVRLLRRVLEELEQHDLVRPVASRDDGDGGFVPAGPLSKLTVREVLQAVRGEVSYDDPRFQMRRGPRCPDVRETLEHIERAWTSAADETTLADLSVPSGAAKSASV